MKKTISATVEHNGRSVFWTLAVGVVGALLCYLYFLCVSVFAAVERNDLVRQVSTMSGEVAMLDASFVREQSKVTLDEAHSRGFGDIVAPKYLENSTTNGNVVAMRNR